MRESGLRAGEPFPVNAVSRLCPVAFQLHLWFATWRAADPAVEQQLD
jgi:hypothetical protein